MSDKAKEAAKRLLADVNTKHRPPSTSLMAEDVRIVARTVLEQPVTGFGSVPLPKRAPRFTEFFGYSAEISVPNGKPLLGHLTATFADQVQERFEDWLSNNRVMGEPSNDTDQGENCDH